MNIRIEKKPSKHIAHIQKTSPKTATTSPAIPSPSKYPKTLLEIIVKTVAISANIIPTTGKKQSTNERIASKREITEKIRVFSFLKTISLREGASFFTSSFFLFSGASIFITSKILFLHFSTFFLNNQHF